MSIIQRPTKQGNATTYQGKVAAGYTTILASEVDADLDLIYSAWNQGVDTTNIKDGSITGSKLAAGAVGTRELTDGGIQTVDIGDAQVTTPKIADGNVTTGKLAPGSVTGPIIAPGTVEGMSGWTDDQASAVHTSVLTRFVGIGTSSPFAQLHVEGQPGDNIVQAMVHNQNATGSNASLRLVVPGADATLYVDRASTEFGVATTAQGQIIHCNPAKGFVQQEQVDLSSRIVGAIVDNAYFLGGQNTTSPFTIKSWTLKAWSPDMRGYRVRIGGTIGWQAGSIDMSLLLGTINLMHWSSPGPAWTSAYWIIDADILTNYGTGSVSWCAQMVQTLQVTAAPAVVQATPWLMRGNSTFPASAVISLQGTFGASAAGNGIDRFTAVLEAL